jgi:hypothetical protein
LTGYHYAPRTGNYQFMLYADDYGKLEINNTLLGTTDKPGTVKGSLYLTEGQYYPIRIAYENTEGTGQLQLWWNLNENQNIIFTDPTFIQSSRKDTGALLDLIAQNRGKEGK